MKLKLLAILLIFACVACSTIEYNSTKVTKEITIDGKIDDWEAGLKYFKDEGMMAGIRNDADFLYLAISISKETTKRQIMMSGLNIWFDPEGGSDKYTGIKFPVGMSGMRMNPQDRGNMPRRGMNHDMSDDEFPEFNEDRENPQSDRPGKMMDIPARIEIIRTEPEESYVVDMKESGIEAKASFQTGTLILEYKIPLRRSTKNMWAIGIDSLSTLGVGILTGEIQRPSMDGEGPDDMGGGPGGGMGGPGGGMGGPGGGMGGPGGGMGGPGGMRNQSSSNIKIWMEVTLAK